jgi:4-diphosphocytidyl-2-C-methyl-D-erythritol kinase
MLAPAKINLYLHITGKRPDGYHSLQSLMVPVGISDKIEVAASYKLELEISGEFAKNSGNLNDNIVIKAAHSLSPDKGAKIILEKNIPVGAGLGGGSSDAAAALLLLNDFWGLHYSKEKLAQIALGLGTDVPFFINNKPAFVSGIGEIIADSPSLPHLHILLINPGKPLSTPAVFKHKPIAFSPKMPAVSNDIFASHDAFISFLKTTRNDLEKNAIELMPEIANVLAEIGKQEGCLLARMSGSGATCFGVFDGEESIKNAAANLKIAQPHFVLI